VYPLCERSPAQHIAIYSQRGVERMQKSLPQGGVSGDSSMVVARSSAQHVGQAAGHCAWWSVGGGRMGRGRSGRIQLALRQVPYITLENNLDRPPPCLTLTPTLLGNLSHVHLAVQGSPSRSHHGKAWSRGPWEACCKEAVSEAVLYATSLLCVPTMLCRACHVKSKATVSLDISFASQLSLCYPRPLHPRLTGAAAGQTSPHTALL